jgi:hypothetical protein
MISLVILSKAKDLLSQAWKTKKPGSIGAWAGALANCFTWPQVALNRHDEPIVDLELRWLAGSAQPAASLTVASRS